MHTMRTNIVIDDDLMAEVLEVTGIKTKREAVEEGLKLLLRLSAQQEILKLRGKIHWEGDLDEMRRDLVARDQHPILERNSAEAAALPISGERTRFDGGHLRQVEARGTLLVLEKNHERYDSRRGQESSGYQEADPKEGMLFPEVPDRTGRGTPNPSGASFLGYTRSGLGPGRHSLPAGLRTSRSGTRGKGDADVLRIGGLVHGIGRGRRSRWLAPEEIGRLLGKLVISLDRGPGRRDRPRRELAVLGSSVEGGAW